VTPFFFTALSKEGPRRVPGRRGIALPAACPPAACLPSQPLQAAHPEEVPERYLGFSFCRETRFKKTRASGAGGRGAAGAMRGEVATPLSPGWISLSCTLHKTFMWVYLPCFVNIFQKKPCLGTLSKQRSRNLPSDLHKAHFRRHFPVCVFPDTPHFADRKKSSKS